MAKMTKQEAIELLKNRKVYVNGKSAEIQKKLFDVGLEWPTTSNKISNTRFPFIYTGNEFISAGYDMGNFTNDSRKEISADEITSIELVHEFKENDVIASGWEFPAGEVCEWIAVIKEWKERPLSYTAKVCLCTKATRDRNNFGLDFQSSYCKVSSWVRPANEGEKRQLIDALKASADPRAKDVLKEVFGIENKPTCPFKPFDKVLVRASNGDFWRAEIFSHFLPEDQPFPPSYLCVGGLWAQCVHYEGNESLLGTNDKPKGKL